MTGRALVASCTNPFTQSGEPSIDDLCPSPPRISYNDVRQDATGGRLDSDLVYVDEYLLEKAEDLDAEVYIRRLLGGFVMSYSEPEFGSCGFGNKVSDVDELEDIVNSSFTQCSMIDGRDFYIILVNSSEFDFFPWLGNVYYCPLLNETESGSGSGEVINGNSLVDGFSANLVQSTICNGTNEDDTSPLAVYTSDFTKQKISATVYYNNNVKYNESMIIMTFVYDLHLCLYLLPKTILLSLCPAMAHVCSIIECISQCMVETGYWKT